MQEQKLVLVGDEGVGKTTLIKRLAFNYDFNPKYIFTLGVEVYPLKCLHMRYNVWDTAGGRFGGLRDGYFINANKAIIMVDATSKLTAKSIKKWYEDLIRVSPTVKIGILVNKMDCKNISEKAINISKNFALEKGLKYLSISVKNEFDNSLIADFLEDING